MPASNSRPTPKSRSKPQSQARPSDIPTPFTVAPESLSLLLPGLDETKVYITHIDTHPIEYKKQIFLVPVLLNGTIAALLAWRIWVAGPKYLALLQALLGHGGSAAVNTAATTTSHQIKVVLRRFGMMLLDFLLFRFVAVWPLTFFLEQPANPITWRWRIGARPKEVVVRVSRHWGCADLMQGVKQGKENAFFKMRLLPAIEREFMRKTGYLMMNGSWDLDFHLMQEIHKLADAGRITLGEFDKVVLVWQEGNGWLAWRWETGSDVMEERRKKVVLFKEALTKMGKEGLFWKWMEIVEDERDTDGGFTPERQKRVADRVGKEFEENGIDFDDLVASVGGLDEMTLKSG